MRTLFLLFFSLTLTTALQAQFGVTALYNLNESRNGTAFTDQLEPFWELDNGYEVAAHYWFRLPNHRVEFQPTVYLHRSETTLGAGNNFTEVGAQFKTNFYIFDFAGDCDCPTFGKQGPQLQKGFFLQLAPGYSRYGYDLTPDTDESFGGFNLGVALGLDFGLSNLLTITPLAGIRYGFSNYSTDINVTDINGQATGVISPKLTTLQLGLQATFRLDEKRY